MLENIINNKKEYLISAIKILVASFIIAISAQISIPMPGGVPMTMQIFSVALIGYILPQSKGLKTILTYLFLGVIGIPVFAGGKSGLITILSITGGFLLGFNLLVLFCGKAKNVKTYIGKILLGIIGLILCHMLGILQYSLITKTSMLTSFTLVSAPFFLKDALSVALAITISSKLKISFDGER